MKPMILALTIFVGAVGCGSSLPPEYPPPPPPQATAVTPPTPPPAELAKPEPPAPIPAASASAAVPETPAPTATADKPPVAAPIALEGSIVSRQGKLLIVKLNGTAPSVGAKGALYRHFEQQIGPINAAGWLGIADVTVKEVKGDKVHLTIDEEKSKIEVNGRKTNHFTAGMKIKLELGS